MKRVLVVEDEASIREMVALNLKMAGWEVVEAPSAERALELMHGGEPCDAALLDIMLPGMDGLSLCETIRRDDSDIGIIIVSAKGQESDKIRGLSIGADDYITKPFSVSELIARLEALTRRIHRGTGAAKPAEEPEQLVSGPFVLDEKSRILYKSGTPIDLTQVEFQIMELFFRNPATALVREKNSGGRLGQELFRRCQDRGCEHPPPADEDRGRAQQPPAYHDRLGLRLPLECVTAAPYKNAKGGTPYAAEQQQYHPPMGARQPAYHRVGAGAGGGAFPLLQL